jgi:NAD(P)H-nitrite reductase large subunit
LCAGLSKRRNCVRGTRWGRLNRYVIIGNSAGGIGGIEGLRRVDPFGEITVISDEPYHTYSRPLISYLLLGKTTLEEMKYRGNDFYKKNNTRLIHAKVTAINSEKKTCLLDNGESLSYDKLLIATGSRPFVPPVKGFDTVAHSFRFMTLSDALTLKDAVTKESRVLIVGAGLIGLKCAEGLSGIAGSLTVIDLSPRILSSILDDDGAKLVQKRLRDNGISFILGTSISEYNGNKAVLSNGEAVEFDILVTAVGVRPNTELAIGAGCDIDRGIKVNAHSETTVPGIFAAGDCTEAIDTSSGESRIMALLPNAYMQGEAAGCSMAGDAFSFSDPIPMNAIGFFGLHILTAGSYTGEATADCGEDSMKKLYVSENRLKGFILIGDVHNAGIYTALIREKTPLDSIDFELIAKSPGLMAFSRKYRDSRLGGAV